MDDSKKYRFKLLIQIKFNFISESSMESLSWKLSSIQIVNILDFKQIEPLLKIKEEIGLIRLDMNQYYFLIFTNLLY